MNPVPEEVVMYVCLLFFRWFIFGPFLSFRFVGRQSIGLYAQRIRKKTRSLFLSLRGRSENNEKREKKKEEREINEYDRE